MVDDAVHHRVAGKERQEPVEIKEEQAGVKIFL
jgi:hypothetical protein